MAEAPRAASPCQPSETPSDEDLVCAARRGEAGAFRAIYDRYAPRLYGVCVGRTGDRQSGCDLLQEVFLQAFRGLAGLRDPSRLREWLFAIALNAVRSHGAGEQRRRRLLGAYQPERVRVEPDEEAQPLLRELRIAAVREVLGAVEDERQRLLLERYYGDTREPTTRALAAELGMPPSTVTVTLMRARAAVARRLVVALAALEGAA